MFEKMRYILTRKEKITMVFLFLAVFVGSIFELMGVTIFMPFIQVLMTPEQIYTNKWLHYFYALFNFKSTTQYHNAVPDRNRRTDYRHLRGQECVSDVGEERNL